MPQSESIDILINFYKNFKKRPNQKDALKLANALKHFDWHSVSTDASNRLKAERLLFNLLSFTEIDNQEILHSTGQLLQYKYQLLSHNENTVWSIEMFEDLSKDNLFLKALESGLNRNSILEFFLTSMRKYILINYRGKVLSNHIKDVVVALSSQCFINEFAFYMTEEESSLIEQCMLSLIDLESAEDSSLWLSSLLLISLYQPLVDLPHANHIADRLKVDQSSLSFQVPVTLWKRILFDPLEEKKLRSNIKSFGEIIDSTSLQVKQQYDENPFPRWFHLKPRYEKKVTTFLKRKLKYLLPENVRPPFFDNDFDVLIAGCGSGRQPISFARDHPDDNILAVDLSRTNLAYSMRMADKFNLNNLKFLQGDILNLRVLGLNFHFVSSVGVLHHMADPKEGLSTIADVLRPGGFLQLGVYSQRSRWQIGLIRSYIEKNKLLPNANNMRLLRRELMTNDKLKHLASDIMSGPDFYSLSMFRDLCFHAQEHTFTIQDIEQLICDAELKLLEFRIQNKEIVKRYKKMFQFDPFMRDLNSWQLFEKEFVKPGSMSMYNIWLQKPNKNES